jgi:hypothetical protein
MLGMPTSSGEVPCDAAAVIRRYALALALLLGCDKPADECQRAVARLARIKQAKGDPTTSKAPTERMLESCRTGKYAAYDPVLRCAMDSRTDEIAAECIDRGLKEVLGGSGDGSGVNPLLSE